MRRLKSLKNIGWLTNRQLTKLTSAMTVSDFDRRSVIFDESAVPESAYLLLSGVARITCRNRQGERTMVIMVAPGMIPGFPLPVVGVKCGFRCEAVTNCQIGKIGLDKFIEISLGIPSADFKRMAGNYIGRWDLVQLRCANFMSCSLKERVALTLLELGENFGVRHPHGLRLTVPARHQDVAELVGASRPRVTEHLLEFERKHMIRRQKRQLVVNRARLESFLALEHRV